MKLQPKFSNYEIERFGQWAHKILRQKNKQTNGMKGNYIYSLDICFDFCMKE